MFEFYLRMIKTIYSNIPGLNQVIFIFNKLTFNLKVKVLFLFFLILITSLAEFNFLINFGSFINYISANNKIIEYNFIQKTILQNFTFYKDNLSLFFSQFLAISVLISSGLRIFLIWQNALISADLEVFLGTRFFKNTISNDYSFFLEESSDKIISALSTHVPASGSAIRSFFLFFTSLFMSSGVIYALLNLQPFLTIISSLIFILIYWTIALTTKNIVLNASKLLVETNARKINVIQQGIGGIRDIILDNSYKYLENEFRENSFKELKARAKQQFIAMSPRYILEAIAISLACLLVYFNSGNDISLLAPIAIVALGAQRLLPSINQLFNGWMGVVGASESLKIIVNGFGYKRYYGNFEILNKKKTEIKFKSSIFLSNVFYGYPNSNENILENINLKIGVNENIALVGPSGSGKTTLTDLILGLIYPKNGEIFIDNELLSNKNIDSWQSQIAHVPQFIYLSNDSIANNIAFCRENSSKNYSFIKEVCKAACLDKYILSLPNGYETIIGERGIKMSGGQRQRLAIARALYKNPQLLILDEATSALDDKTQNDLMQSLKNFYFDRTIIQITHRESNLRYCDNVYFVENKSIRKK